MDTTQAVTLAIAVLGAVLGVINTWHELSRHRRRVRVRMIWVFDGSGVRITSSRLDAPDKFPNGSVAIEVINTGLVPVHVGQVGFCRAGWLRRNLYRSGTPRERANIVSDAAEKVRLPCELAPGTRVTISAAQRAHDLPSVLGMTHIYAMTEDERVFYARAALLRKLAQQ